MGSMSFHLIPILEQVLLSEIGEANITPLGWSKTSNDSYIFVIEINGHNEHVNVEFEEMKSQNQLDYFLPPKWRNLKIWNVAYNVSGKQHQFAKTDLKTLLTILSTIVSIIKDYVNRTDPEAMFIQPVETELGTGDISKKRNIYKAFIMKQVRNIGNYIIDTYRDGFIVIRLK